jgi:HAD superfamily hydrolase (TIGR01662 family)
MPLPIRAVLFDMGDTLNKADVVHPGEIFQRILTSLGISKSLDEIKMAWLNAEKEAEDINLLSQFGKLQREEYWHKWDSLVLKHLGIAENVELAKTVQSKWFDFVDFILYPEVKDVLMKLQQRGLKLGLISTAYEEEIHLVLERVNLEKATFDIIVGVDAAQCMKPHPEIFKYAIKKLDVRPEEAIFVGDDVGADYEGAENAGLHALLIDRTEKQKQSGLRTIKNLNEILSQIDLGSSTSHKN